MLIEYRTIEGHVIERVIERDYATINDIDSLAMQYFEKTGREPEAVFMDWRWLSKLQMDLGSFARYQSFNAPPTPQIVNFMLSMGPVPVIPVRTSYIPILVGSRAEFDDNDIHKIFEDIVLRGCERE